MKKFQFSCVLLLLATSMALPATAESEHPTISHAITSLEQTKTELQAGEHGFGGHRSKAIEHIDAALKELHLALDYAHDHPESIKPSGQ